MTASREKTEPRKLPMMPIRDMVIFPYMMTPFVVGRVSSVRALEEALNGDRKIFLATQHDASIDEPKAKEIYQVGSICNIVQSVKMPDGNIKVLVEGVERAKSIEVNDRDGFFVATVRTGKTDFEMTPAVEQLMQRVTGLFEQYVKLQQSLNYETIIASVRMDEPAKLSDTIAANLQLGIEEKQELLAIFDPAARLARIADVLDIEIEKLDLDRNIQSRVKRQMERAQKEYYLNEKIKAIQKELGRGEKSEFDELRKKIEVAGMPKEVLEKAIQELKKLEAMPPMSAESTVSRNYIDWLLAVPWKKRSKETRSIDYAEKVLNDRPLRPGKNQGAHSRISRRAAAGEESEGLDLVLRRASGSGQDFAGHVDRQGHGAQVCAALAGRRARRGRDSRPPAHLYRRAAGSDHPAHEARGHQESCLPARRSGQDGLGLPRRSGIGAAGGAGPGAEHDLPGSLSRRGLRLVAGAVCGDGQRDAHHSGRAAGPHGSAPAAGYTEQEKLEIARQYLVKKQRKQTGLSEKNIVFHGRCDSGNHPHSTRARRACATWSAKSATSAARWRARW